MRTNQRLVRIHFILLFRFYAFKITSNITIELEPVKPLRQPFHFLLLYVLNVLITLYIIISVSLFDYNAKV